MDINTTRKALFGKFCDNIIQYQEQEHSAYFLDDTDREEDSDIDPKIVTLLFKKVKTNSELIITKLHKLWNVAHIHNTRGPVKMYIKQLIRAYYKLYVTEDPELKIQTVLLIILYDNHNNNKLPYDKQIAGNFMISILINHSELYHTKYMKYITWSIKQAASVYATLRLSKYISSREQFFPVLLDTWKEEITPLMFFQFISYQNSQFTIIETDYDTTYEPHYASNKFSKLPDFVTDLILTCLFGNVLVIKNFLQNK